MFNFLNQELKPLGEKKKKDEDICLKNVSTSFSKLDNMYSISFIKYSTLIPQQIHYKAKNQRIAQEIIYLWNLRK